MRNTSAECFIGNADGVLRARERRVEPQSRWNKEATNNVIGVLWRMTDGRWKVDRPEIRVGPVPILPLPFRERRILSERITKQDIDEFGATVGCAGCNAIKDDKWAQALSDSCRVGIEKCLRITPHGAERSMRRWLRRYRVENTLDSMENPLEPDPNPKRRLLMKSTSSTASGSGQQRENRPDTDTEPRKHTGDPLEKRLVKAQLYLQHRHAKS